MVNLEQKMIYLSGKNNQEGFTLLEVLVAITIFVVAFTVLIKIQTASISEIEKSLKKLEALKFFKEEMYTIPERETSRDDFTYRTKKRKIHFGINEIIHTISDRKTGERILEIKTYEE
ncbi:type IV pilus modification PilV family protein [Persephonella sp.]